MTGIRTTRTRRTGKTIDNAYYERRYFPYGFLAHAVNVIDPTQPAVCGLEAPFQENWRLTNRMEQCKKCVNKIGDDW
jgi:hypothetical protein